MGIFGESLKETLETMNQSTKEESTQSEISETKEAESTKGLSNNEITEDNSFIYLELSCGEFQGPSSAPPEN